MKATPDIVGVTAQREVLSVSDLTQIIKSLLEEELDALWLTGEISNFKRHSSGHFYFSLKDENSQLPCVMWAGRNRALLFAPEDGMQVMAHGRVTVYDKRGYYQFETWQMQPAGLGALQLAFEQLKRRLQHEGLFDPERKRPLPAYPERVGIVTSPTGAAIRDFISVLRRRWPAIKIILRPVRVQGQGAAEEIAAAIREFNEFVEVDVLLIGRGGGSLEDLWPFNEEIVARAIAASEIPVVSAVGHEIDFSISDFVADMRAATPSVAAELIVREASVVKQELYGLLKRAYLSWRQTLAYHRQQLNAFARSYAFRKPQDLVHQRTQQLDDLQHRLELSIARLLESRKQSVHNAHARLRALSHDSILKRGFAMIRRTSDEALLTTAEAARAESDLQIRFHDGTVGASVKGE